MTPANLNRSVQMLLVLTQNFSQFKTVKDKKENLQRIKELVQTILSQYERDWKNSLQNLFILSQDLKESTQIYLKGLRSHLEFQKAHFTTNPCKIHKYFNSAIYKIKRKEHSEDIVPEIEQLRNSIFNTLTRLQNYQTLSQILNSRSITVNTLSTCLRNIRLHHFQQAQLRVAQQIVVSTNQDVDFPDSDLGNYGDIAFIEQLDSVRKLISQSPKVVEAFLSLIKKIQAKKFGTDLQEQLRNFPDEAFQEHRLLVLLLCYISFKSNFDGIYRLFSIPKQKVLDEMAPLHEHIDISIIERLHTPEKLNEDETTYLSLIRQLAELCKFPRQHYACLGWIYHLTTKENPTPFNAAILCCLNKDFEGFIENWNNIDEFDFNKIVHAYAFAALTFQQQAFSYLEANNEKLVIPIYNFIIGNCCSYAPRLAYYCLLIVADNFDGEEQTVLKDIMKKSYKNDPVLFIDFFNAGYSDDESLCFRRLILRTITEQGCIIAYELTKQITNDEYRLFCASRILDSMTSTNPLGLIIIKEMTPSAIKTQRLSFAMRTQRFNAPESLVLLEAFSNDIIRVLHIHFSRNGKFFADRVMTAIEKIENLQDIVEKIIRSYVLSKPGQDKILSILIEKQFSYHLILNFYCYYNDATRKQRGTEIIQKIPCYNIYKSIQHNFEILFTTERRHLLKLNLDLGWDYKTFADNLMHPYGLLIKRFLMPHAKTLPPLLTDENILIYVLLTIIPWHYFDIAAALIANIKEDHIQKEVLSTYLENKSQEHQTAFAKLLADQYPSIALKIDPTILSQPF